jgi:hypothetical protein
VVIIHIFLNLIKIISIDHTIVRSEYVRNFIISATSLYFFFAEENVSLFKLTTILCKMSLQLSGTFLTFTSLIYIINYDKVVHFRILNDQIQ